MIIKCVFIILYHILISHLDPFMNIILQPGVVGKVIVGQRQDVVCSISVPPDVDSDTIELSWLNEDDIITNDSRITIYASKNDTTLIKVIRFEFLVEEDEGKYTCYSIMNGSFATEFINLYKFISKQ